MTYSENYILRIKFFTSWSPYANNWTWIYDNIIDARLEFYLTAKIKVDDATNIMINDANADRDAITGLRAPTNFGRPNWDMVFKSVRKIHSPAEAGVFFCGPKVLGSQLHIKCNMYTEPGKFIPDVPNINYEYEY